MARVKHQDRDAFSILVDRHLDSIYQFAHRHTRDAHTAEDVAQETFLRVWTKAATWRPGRVRVTTWLHKIAHNLCIDLHRRQRPQAELDEQLVDDGQTAPEDVSENERLAAALDNALRALPERQRTALMLCQRQNMSNPQAAQVLGISVDAVESLLARARRTLRVALRDYRVNGNA